MGTNYYAEQDACENPCIHCRQEDWHIGKSLTMFEAHETSPWGKVDSWQAWKRVISLPSVTVRDEYGHVHEADDFIARVEATSADQRRRQYDWMVEHGDASDRDWLCPDGFSFCRGEFT